MNISELIRELESFKEKHGDLKVWTDEGEVAFIVPYLVMDDSTDTVCFISCEDEDEDNDWCEDEKGFDGQPVIKINYKNDGSSGIGERQRRPYGWWKGAKL